jgi:hypothetical protein
VGVRQKGPRVDPACAQERKKEVRKINTYILKNLSVEQVALPKGSKILTVMDFNGEPVLYADIPMEELETEEWTFWSVPAYKPFSEEIAGKQYVSSIIHANYGIVFSFYTEPPKAKE